MPGYKSKNFGHILRAHFGSLDSRKENSGINSFTFKLEPPRFNRCSGQTIFKISLINFKLLPKILHENLEAFLFFIDCICFKNSNMYWSGFFFLRFFAICKYKENFNWFFFFVSRGTLYNRCDFRVDDQLPFFDSSLKLVYFHLLSPHQVKF